jgi:uncharacterized protein YpuA (DUF1002 family)
MPKGLISFIVVSFIAVAAAVIIFMKQSAYVARKRSDEIMRQFKTVDKDLQKTNERLDTLNKMDFDSVIKVNK